MQLNEQQSEGLDKLFHWWKHERFSRPFILHGYAGTGKTTVTKEALKRLVEMGADSDRIHLAAPTGKASQILSRKAERPASTLHRLLYKPMSEEIDGYKQQLTDIFEDLEDKEAYDNDPEVKRIHGILDKLEKSDAKFSHKGLTEAAELIVVDEMSMVPTWIAADLEKTEVPLLLIGDPFQLPPVKSEMSWEDIKPDVLLTKIMRQKGEGSGIVLAAQDIRLGGMPKNGEGFKLLPKGSVKPEDFMGVDVVICGKNDIRVTTNNWYRRTLGYPKEQIVVGEKIICTRNQPNFPVKNGTYNFWNGELFTVKALGYSRSANSVTIDIEDCYGQVIERVPTWLPHFFNEDYSRVPHGHIVFQFAYAITCHKSQGSEFDKTLVNGVWPGSHYDQWLYTAVTRAMSSCLLSNYLG